MAKKAATPAPRTNAKAIARRKTPLRKTHKAATNAPVLPVSAPNARTKLEVLVALLRARRGATVPDMMEATGWQAHSVRGALAGALKKRGLTITSDKPDGEERRYRAEAAK